MELEQRRYRGMVETCLLRARYMRYSGRVGPAGDEEIERLERLLADCPVPDLPQDANAPIGLPLTLSERLAWLRRRELRRYQEMVCADARDLRQATRRLVAELRCRRMLRTANAGHGGGGGGQVRAVASAQPVRPD